jgi:hypothetical protein
LPLLQEAVDKQASIFDGDIYDNPPPLSQTLMGKSSSDASPASPADDLSSGTFGPGQVSEIYLESTPPRPLPPSLLLPPY